MGQCFQEVGLTKRINIIAKQCPNNAYRMKTNFIKCIREYLEAVAGVPNVGNQLIHWLRTAKKPALMLMHEFLRHRVQLISYLNGGYLRQTMEIPTAQERTEQIFFALPKEHQFKFADTNKLVPTDPLKLIAFFEQCQAANKVAGILEKIAKDKKQQKEKKTHIFPLRIAVNRATSSIVATSIATTIKATDAVARTNNLTVVIETINATIVLVATIRTLRAASPTKRRMSTMTSPLCQAWATCPEKVVAPTQDLLCALVPGLDLA
jgi:hypothetical protein